MAANYFKTLRKSYIVHLLFSSVLSNIVVFGQPIQEMVLRHNSNTSVLPVATAASPVSSPLAAHTNKTSGTVLPGNPAQPVTVFSLDSAIYYAPEAKGTIGKLLDSDVENPEDNFFSINIPQATNLGNYQAILTYDLYGVTSASQTTKSINNNASYGGKFVTTSNVWVTVQEEVASSQLKPGNNEIFFNRRVEENYQFKVRNVRIELKEKKSAAISLTEKAAINFSGNLYLLGVADAGVDNVWVMGQFVPVTNGVFEKVLSNIPKNSKDLEVSYSLQNNGQQTVTFPIAYQAEDSNYQFNASALELSGITSTADMLALAPVNYKSASVSIDVAQLQKKHNKVTVQGLRFKDIKGTDLDLKNVTAGDFRAYRLTNHSLSDSVSMQVRIKYDTLMIPDGYTARDIKTFYFDKSQRSWKALPVDSLDTTKQEIISTAYGNDTDFINGVIQVPDSPETGSFAPTMISDMKYADPAAGVVSIAPPSANSTGGASTSFPIKLPQGRNGMQPSLNVTYNSEGGNGWMGVGWNLSTPAITLNTKWGAPLFDPESETEIYSLNGSDLVLKIGYNYTNPHRSANTIARNYQLSSSNDRTFYERKEGGYQKIVRHGHTPDTYCWEITDNHGNKSFYGKISLSDTDDNAVIRTGGATGNIAYWALKRTQDPYGNYIDYTYSKNETAISESPLVNAQEFYISKITYTLYTGEDASSSNRYEVIFRRTGYTLPPLVATPLPNFYFRKDAIIDGRNGYLQLTDEVLTEILISFINAGETKRVRSYRFDYDDIAFRKTQLVSISEFDAGNTLFYTNKLEYYDDSTEGIFTEGSTNWTADDSDAITSPLQVLAGTSPLTIPSGSLLGTSVSSGISGGARGGFGLGRNVKSVNNTLGFSGSYSSNTQDARISFIDINGDGLPDKVYRADNKVYYRRNNGSGFDALRTLTGSITELSKTKSRTFGGGVDANVLGKLGIGKSFSKTRSETDSYFSDVNGDGLPDMVSGGRVRFNRTAASGVDFDRYFDQASSTTPNPIVSGAISPDIVGDLQLATLNELREENPQYDHVKVWQVPYTGKVKISGSATLLAKTPNGANTPSVATSTFRLTIEKGRVVGADATATASTLLTSSVDLNAQYSSVTMTQTAFDVKKGDLIFFRVHNRNYGWGGEVEWNPTITYTQMDVMTLNTAIKDDNKKYMHIYNALEDFSMNNGGAVQINPEDTSIDLDFNLPAGSIAAYKFSDNINFIIKKVRINTNDGSETDMETWTRSYNHSSSTTSAIFTGSSSTILNHPVGNTQDFTYVLQFYTESTSNVDWGAIGWVPKFTGNNTGIHYPGVSHNTYDNNVNQSQYWIYNTSLVTPTGPVDANTPLMVVSHNFFDQDYSNILGSLSSGSSVKVNWIVKQEIGTTIQVLNTVSFYVNKSSTGAITYTSAPSPEGNYPIFPTNPYFFQYVLSKQVVQNIKNGIGKLYSAFYVDNVIIAANNNANITLSVHPDQASSYPNFAAVVLNKPFFAADAQFYGFSYRGWGQFLYNGGLKHVRDENGDIVTTPPPTIYGDLPIETSLFNYVTLSSGAQDIDPGVQPNDVVLGDSDQQNTVIRYTFYSQKNQEKKYVNESIINAIYGINPDNKLSSTVGRFGQQNIYDVYVNPLDITATTTGVFPGIKQRSESKGSAVTATVISAGASGTDSKAKSKVINQYIDANGDRYPDIVTGGHIQYTNMRGALSTVKPNNNFVSSDESDDATIGASLAALQPNSTDSDSGGVASNKTITFSKSGINVSSGKSFNTNLWADMNGDGLPDKVSFINDSDAEKRAVEVYLNTGYGFTDKIVWGHNYPVNLTLSNRVNAGAGVPFSFSPSFGGGFGAALSTAVGSTDLIDVNGDQLPDLILATSSNSYTYYLNTGRSFYTGSATFYDGDISKDSSLSGNLFGSFTWGTWFTIFGIDFKIVVSPTAGANAGFNEKNATVQDINGDGLNDIISKPTGANNNTVTAVLNTVGRTHLLKRVYTPLGGYFNIVYERSVNTYNMPNSKWLLSSVGTDDGFTADNNYSPGNTYTAFTYENPKYDRREREFLGYEKVKTFQYDPTSLMVPYRTVVKSYHNENYYLSGAEKGTALYNQSQELLSEETTLYNLLDPDVPVVNLNATGATNFLQTSLVANAATYLDQSRLLIAVARVTSTSYENGVGLTAVKEFTSYTNFGNLATYIDYGEGPEDAYKTAIAYYPESTMAIENGIGFPKRITVTKNGTGQLLRQRDAFYHPGKGKLKTITTALNASETSTKNFDYDVYGNLITVTDVDNLNSTNTASAPYVQTIGYDTVLKMYPVSFSNAFGETSSTAYNYMFGIPVLTTDMNGQKMRTRIDNRGRLVEVTGPNEMDETVTSNVDKWTIRMQYEGSDPISSPVANATNSTGSNVGSFMYTATGSFTPPVGTQVGTSQHHAITRHFDPEIPTGSTTATNQFLTVSIVDGFGQPVQVKKTHWAGAFKWQINGLEEKDGFGRTLKSYLPFTNSFYPNDITNLSAHWSYTPPPPPPNSPSLDQEVAVEMTYDAKDRVRTVKQPGITPILNIDYAIEDGMLVQNSTNEGGQTNDVYTDIRGRQRKTVQNDQISTYFSYDAINQLISVTDNNGFITGYTYDNAGRKIEMRHPDRGMVTFKYDRASRLTSQSNSNLIAQNNNSVIRYYYDYGRLIRIAYPTNQYNEVKYTYGKQSDAFAVSEHAVGRLLYQEDASGMQVFSYGLMGEVTKNLRSVAVAGYQSYWFLTRWKYDSWNRVQEIVYPDQEVVTYNYNRGGMLASIGSQINGIANGTGTLNQDIIKAIVYNDLGQRIQITRGNDTNTFYTYDIRQRLSSLSHSFTGANIIRKDYTYDELSNITDIITFNPQSALPGTGRIGGPVKHHYTYDNYNRLETATGSYTGANDNTLPYVRQEYNLVMEYNTDHTIKKKTQYQTQGTITNYDDPLAVNKVPVYKNSYVLEYANYGGSAKVSTNPATNNSYGYQQPHAVRKITESPAGITNLAVDDPRIRQKEIVYDANGNQKEIKENVGGLSISLRKNLWDEENRLRAVDLKPDENTNRPIAIYTYNAGGERIVRYNYDREDVFSNSKDASVNHTAKSNVMLYPSGLVMGKATQTKDDRGKTVNRLTYTKHYYIGSERVSAKTGTIDDLGYYPATVISNKWSNLTPALATPVRAASNQSVTDARSVINNVKTELAAALPAMATSEDGEDITQTHIPGKLNIYYFHSDHLGSSSYMTNAGGTISQHMEYLPFGETMVEEHINSNNSPFKFNCKEFDEETGNYYYGARYYDPKWSIFTSVDPLAEKTFSPYGYCYQNPINLIDPDGNHGVRIVDKKNKTITIKANYYVQTEKRYTKNNTNGLRGYSKEEIMEMQIENNKYLNDLGAVVSEGEYEGYAVKFDLQFKEGGGVPDTEGKASDDIYEGFNIGNSFTRWDNSYKPFDREEGDNYVGTTKGGYTEKYQRICMNTILDYKRNRIHEIFHTFGFDDFPEDKAGIMNYPPENVNQKDIDALANGKFLPVVKLNTDE